LVWERAGDQTNVSDGEHLVEVKIPLPRKHPATFICAAVEDLKPCLFPLFLLAYKS